jgi:hypothetical protein
MADAVRRCATCSMQSAVQSGAVQHLHDGAEPNILGRGGVQYHSGLCFGFFGPLVSRGCSCTLAQQGPFFVRGWFSVFHALCESLCTLNGAVVCEFTPSRVHVGDGCISSWKSRPSLARIHYLCNKEVREILCISLKY